MSKRKLLLADDSITIQKVVNLTFADEGIEVISVGDGDSAMRKFDEFMPDLVMADVNMPGLSGYEVCRIIKRTEETQDIPVILLVGSFEPFDEAEAQDAGADDFLTKPFQSIRQLVNKVTDLLNQRERATEASPEETAEQPPADDHFAETLAFENPEDALNEAAYRKTEIGSEYGDAGMDDEMIETTPANDYLAESPSVYQAETTIDYAKTQPLTSEDIKGFDIVPNAAEEQPAVESAEDQEPAAEFTEELPSQRAEAASFDEEARKLGYFPSYGEREETSELISETEPEIDYYLPEGETEDPAEFEKEITDAETLEPEISYENESPRTPDFSQASSEETDETESPEDERAEIQEAAPYSFNENEYTGDTDYQEDAPVAPTEAVTEEFKVTPPAETGFDEAAQTAPPEEAEEFAGTAETGYTVQAEEPPSEEAEESIETETETPVAAFESAPSFANFDDGDLLELPPLVEETGIRPQPKIQPAEAVETPAAETASETDAVTAEAPESPVESEAAQAFPPELIEAIAQKVAEKISAKTMSDVLPQITELVMKKLAEENQESKK